MSNNCRCFPVTDASHLSLGVMSVLLTGVAANAFDSDPLSPSATAPAATLPRNSLRLETGASLIRISLLRLNVDTSFVTHYERMGVVFVRQSNAPASDPDGLTPVEAQAKYYNRLRAACRPLANRESSPRSRGGDEY